MASLTAVDRTPNSACRSMTEDGWIRLTEQNLELGHRYIEIMCQMNGPTYATDRPDKIARRMAKYPCEYSYFPGEDFEIVCGFRWNRYKQRYRWMSVGFVGAITPAQATDLAAWRVRRFLLDKQGHRVFAIEPLVMENPAILELYRLIHQHPAVVLRGSHRIADGTFLWIELPADSLSNSRSPALS